MIHLMEERNLDEWSKPILASLTDASSEWVEFASAVYKAHKAKRPLGPVTGFPTLDAAIGGALRPGIHIVRGQPRVGKTAFALHVTASTDCPVLYVSCETSPLTLFQRLMARATGTPMERLLSGEIAPKDAEVLGMRTIAFGESNWLPDFLDGSAELPDARTLRYAASATRRGKEHLLVVIDSLDTWTEAVSGAAYDGSPLEASLATLRSLVEEMDCAVLAITQARQGALNTGGHLDGVGQRRVEHRAETVLDLSWGQNVPPDVEGEVPITVSVVKNRHGAHGDKIELLFHRGFQRFRERR